MSERKHKEKKHKKHKKEKSSRKKKDHKKKREKSIKSSDSDTNSNDNEYKNSKKNRHHKSKDRNKVWEGDFGYLVDYDARRYSYSSYGWPQNYANIQNTTNDNENPNVTMLMDKILSGTRLFSEIPWTSNITPYVLISATGLLSCWKNLEDCIQYCNQFSPCMLLPITRGTQNSDGKPYIILSFFNTTGASKAYKCMEGLKIAVKYVEYWFGHAYFLRHSITCLNEKLIIKFESNACGPRTVSCNVEDSILNKLPKNNEDSSFDSNKKDTINDQNFQNRKGFNHSGQSNFPCLPYQKYQDSKPELLSISSISNSEFSILSKNDCMREQNVIKYNQNKSNKDQPFHVGDIINLVQDIETYYVINCIENSKIKAISPNGTILTVGKLDIRVVRSIDKLKANTEYSLNAHVLKNLSQPQIDFVETFYQ